MTKPEGGISREDTAVWGQYASRYPDRNVFLVTNGGGGCPWRLVTHTADWYAYNMAPPCYYFTNYLLAYGYLLRMKVQSGQRS